VNTTLFSGPSCPERTVLNLRRNDG
jgi:hypothetical protein